MSPWTVKDRRQQDQFRDRGPARAEGTDRMIDFRRPEGRGSDPDVPGAAAAASGQGRPLTDRSKDELYQEARRLKIEGRSRMSKEQLLRAIESAARWAGES